MKPKIFNKLKTPSHLFWADILLIAIPMLIWASAFSLRPSFIKPKCAINPSSCVKENVFFLDQITLGKEIEEADGLSFWSQNLSGAFSVCLILFWAFFLFFSKIISLKASCIQFFIDSLLILQATIWNGALNEICRLIIQRPRPFVYSDPSQSGLDIAHYTSFYSGHTSFAAVSTVTAILCLMGRKFHPILLKLSFIISFYLIFFTGFFRVFSGRHFITDVVAAAIAGTVIAFSVVLLHKKPTA
ncbi:MAG: phosphatase PAP2 family protein [Deltaproteobacteria bacterium]|nr:phosphatase PAP2 family protein [Deltaproteobacteria bacterium]